MTWELLAAAVAIAMSYGLGVWRGRAIETAPIKERAAKSGARAAIAAMRVVLPPKSAVVNCEYFHCQLDRLEKNLGE